MKIYLAEYRYGSGNVTEYEVEEKNKTYKIINNKDIIGWCWVYRMIRKDDGRICKSLHDAILKIEADAKEYLDRKEWEYVEALDSYNVIHEVSAAIKLDPSKLDKALAELG